jgi:hypothetical protein
MMRLISTRRFKLYKQKRENTCGPAYAVPSVWNKRVRESSGKIERSYKSIIFLDTFCFEEYLFSLEYCITFLVLSQLTLESLNFNKRW